MKGRRRARISRHTIRFRSVIRARASGVLVSFRVLRVRQWQKRASLEKNEDESMSEQMNGWRWRKRKGGEERGGREEEDREGRGEGKMEIFTNHPECCIVLLGLLRYTQNM